ncbi:MAG: hypothetical protein KJ578_03010 [Bacteroidetes bacterium]|nr:hypothetical protein [Bacteroidota bacterium]MBU1579169.1 hypothetical protein [Bacteroidota bacterium]MBU2556732.1 hypothetical protein [Bacteroidota bacterium]
MKYLIKISGLGAIVLLLYTACCNEKKANEPILEGIYIGTLTGSHTNNNIKLKLRRGE